MIAVDSCVVIDLLQGAASAKTAQLEDLLRNAQAIIAPATLTELLSDPSGQRATKGVIDELKMLPLLPGYWGRAGLLRAKVRKAGRKAALGDALIAQACIDNDVALLTRDEDFNSFAKLGGLKLA